MAAHVTERSGPEIGPAPPVERVVDGVIRTFGSGSEPQVPIEALRHGGRVGGTVDALRPDRPVAPDVHLAHRPEHTGLHPFRRRERGSDAQDCTLICVATPFSFAVFASNRASTMVCVIGLAQYTCLPSFMAAIAITACVWSGVPIITASMSLSFSSMTRKSRYRVAFGYFAKVLAA